MDEFCIGWRLVSILWKSSLRRIPDLSKNLSLKSHSFGNETTVSWVLSEIDVCLSVAVATAIKYLSATALHPRCICSRAYRIREIIMRTFISFDKRLWRLQLWMPCFGKEKKNRHGGYFRRSGLRHDDNDDNRLAGTPANKLVTGLDLCIGFPLTNCE